MLHHRTAAAAASDAATSENSAVSRDDATTPETAKEASSASIQPPKPGRAVDAHMAADVTPDQDATDADDKSHDKTSEVEQREITVADQRDTTRDEEFEIKRLASHRVDDELCVVDFRVEWKSGEFTWESESDLQLQVPAVVLEYWRRHGGRQEVTGLDEFHVLKVLDRRPKPPSYLVQWVGYRSTAPDTTWESKKLLREIAPEQLAEFETIRPCKPGRPRKRGRAKNSEPAGKRLKPA